MQRERSRSGNRGQTRDMWWRYLCEDSDEVRDEDAS